MIYPNQKECTNILLENIDEKKLFQVLLAQMQSGKSGIYINVAIRYILNGKGKQQTRHVFIVTGNRDISLRAQTHRDLEEAIKEKIDQYHQLEEDGIIDKDEMNEIKNSLKNSIEVVWGQDIVNADISDETKDCLIIHDESHCAQSKNNIPFREFYARLNLVDSLHGDFEELERRNISIINVSATPLSEIVSNQRIISKGFIGKEIVMCNPGRGYVGIEVFMEKKRIHFTAKSITGVTCHFKRILSLYKTFIRNRYVIVRTHQAENDEQMMRSIARSTEFSYRSVFGKNSDDNVWDFLKTPPSKPTIVHICGKARMGQQITKKHIAIAYEQSKKPNIDTILQGLLGRLCGYDYESSMENDLPLIFVSSTTRSGILDYKRSWETGNISNLTNIKKATNLSGKTQNSGPFEKDGDKKKWVKLVPIKFNVSDLDTTWSEIKSRTDCLSVIEDKIFGDDEVPKIECNNTQKDMVTARTLFGRRFQARDGNNETYIREGVVEKLENAIESKTRFTHNWNNNITQFKTTEVKPFICFYDNIKDCIYLTGYIPYDVNEHRSLKENLPHVKEICNYVQSELVIDETTTIDNFNGGQIIPFPFKEASKNLDLFEENLIKAIHRTKPSHCSYIQDCSSFIISMSELPKNRNCGIYLSKCVFIGEAFDHMKDRIIRLCNLSELVFEKAPGRNPSEFLKYKKISWKLN